MFLMIRPATSPISARPFEIFEKERRGALRITRKLMHNGSYSEAEINLGEGYERK